MAKGDFIRKSTTLTLSGADSTKTADLTMFEAKGKGSIDRILVIVTTPNTGTAYTDFDFELFERQLADAPPANGIYTLFKEIDITLETTRKIINKSNKNFGNIQMENKETAQQGVVSISLTGVGGDGTSNAVVTVIIEGYQEVSG